MRETFKHRQNCIRFGEIDDIWIIKPVFSVLKEFIPVVPINF